MLRHLYKLSGNIRNLILFEFELIQSSQFSQILTLLVIKVICKFFFQKITILFSNTINKNIFTRTF